MATIIEFSHAGITGTIQLFGAKFVFVSWATLNCTFDALRGGLREAVKRAILAHYGY